MTGLDEEVAAMEDAVGKMVKVVEGDYVFAAHPNVVLEFIGHAIEATKLLYEEFKAKTGKVLPFAERMVWMAEIRYELARKVAFGDLVLPRDHNILIDALKPLELALREIEENL